MKNKFNRLSKEKSPYLLQHASNPVDWYPWGREAFDRAKREGKPVFLSIGYSACHWCHVMSHQSFEDEKVAGILNEIFICIKVDREERPDIDHIYMDICQMLTGSGGWPLTIIMTPEQKPFFAATYLPPYSQSGRIGLVELSRQIKHLWQHDKIKVLKAANQITLVLKKPRIQNHTEEILPANFHHTFRSFQERFDPKHGGFGPAPKFPSPQNFIFLLHYWQATKRKPALDMVEKTLSHMAMGGIYDHLGFGFHRYSTDAEWKLPHFEKMLYDQALMANALLDTYQASGNQKYALLAEQTFSYVLKNLVSDNLTFFSAEDADSEGEEGKFYLWQENEIDALLSPVAASLFKEAFNIKTGGNFRLEHSGRSSGTNILYRTDEFEVLTHRLGLETDQSQQILQEAQKTLYRARKKRIPPHKDDKVLTDWNGLMIAALAKGSWILNKPKYLKAAARASHFIWEWMFIKKKTLMHRFRQGEVAIEGFLDDYAFYITALLELYQASFNHLYLSQALQLTDSVMDQFLDKEAGGFFFNSRRGEKLISRQKKITDGATPSANSTMIINLIKLWRLTGRKDYQAAATSALEAFSTKVKPFPAAFPQYMIAALLNQAPFYEIVIAGDPSRRETRQLIHTIRSIYLPQKVIILKNTCDASPELAQLLPFIKHHGTVSGKPAVYICENNYCHAPLTGTRALKKQLEKLKKKSFLTEK